MVEGVEDSGWRSHLTEALQAAWQAELYTDLVITCNDGSIAVHRVVMAAASPYFKALLSAGLVEQKTAKLHLDGMSLETLTSVLQYVYSGRAKLTHHNASDVLALADYFQIHALKNLCCYYLKAELCVETCLSVYEVATLHSCHDLAEAALKVALTRCSDLLQNSAFLSTSPDTIKMLLKQNYLCIESEGELLMGILRWINADPEERSSLLPDLLHHINLDSLKATDRKSLLITLQREQLDNEEVLNLLLPPQPSIRLQHMQDGYSPKSEMSKLPVRHKSEEEVLLVIGGESNGKLAGNMECYAERFSWSCSLPNFRSTQYKDLNDRQKTENVLPLMKTPRTYAATASHDNTIYIIGGQTNKQFLSCCEVYEVSTNSWSSLPDLPFPTHGAAATFLDGNLYCVAGKSSYQYEDKIWVFNKKQHRWEERGKLLRRRGHVCVAALHGALYIIGGAACGDAGIGETLSTCEKYDPATQTSTYVASMSQTRAYHGVAVVDDHLYAVGGYDGAKWLSNVERYDPLRDQWTTVSCMMSRRSSFGITVRNRRIYCVGGFGGQSVVNTVEKYNPRTDMWHGVESMQLRRYGLMAATIHIPGKDD